MAGRPSDLLRAGPHLLVLAEHGLDDLADDTFQLLARIPEARTPFRVNDPYCAPPLTAFQGSIYAGDQLRGGLWKLVAD